MPRGVSEHFIRILRNEAQASLRNALLLLLFLPPAYFMAELADPPLIGTVVRAAALSLLLGLGIGALFAANRNRHYNDSLLRQWNTWQRMSAQHARLHDLARAVHQKGRGFPWRSVLAALFLILNALLFALLWLDAPLAGPLGHLIAPANTLVVGVLVGAGLSTQNWARKTRRAIDDLLAEGQISMWGER